MNKIVLILIAIVLVGIAGFATLWFGVGSDLQERAEAILGEWRDGRVDEIYRDATSEFRQGRTPEQFRAYLDYWKTRRGAFVAVERRTKVSVSSREGDKDSRGVTLEVRFERGLAYVRFVFRPGDVLALLQMALREPDKPVDKADAGVLEAMAHSLFMLYSEKNYIGLYDGLSPELQLAWPPARIETELDALHVMGGRISEEFTQRSLEEEDKGELRTLVYAVDFERGPGQAKIGFQWDDDHWRVVEFRLRLGAN